jgi:hypothetical protein
MRPTGRELQLALNAYLDALRGLFHRAQFGSEIAQLHAFQRQLGLLDSDTQDLRAELFGEYVLHCLGSGYNSEEAVQFLETLGAYLGVDRASPVAATALHSLTCVSLIHSMAKGHLPSAADQWAQLNRRPGELVHEEIADAILLEEHVVSSGWVSGHSGVSFRIAKGVSWRIGGSRGRHVSERAVVPISEGPLMITNQRVVFLGNAKTFTAPWSKVLVVEPFVDGLQIFIDGRAKAPLIQIQGAVPFETEMLATLCSCLMV